MANPFQYTVQASDYGGLNSIARRFGYQNYQQAGITGVPSGNFDLIRPGDVITFGNQPRPNPVINGTNANWNAHNNATGQLNTLTNTPDPYAQLFQQQREANALTAGNAIASATAATERAASQNEQNKQATLAGLATSASKTGLAANSAYQMQVMEGAREQFQTRFALLDQQEKLSIAKAKAAQAVGDTAVLEQELKHAAELRQEKARAMEEAQKLEWEKYKFENLSAAEKASEARLSAKDKAQAAKDAADTAAGETGQVFDNAFFIDNYSTGELFKLAQNFGIPRVRSGSRQPEIKAFLAKLPELIAAYRAAGKTDEEIQAYFESKMY